MKKVSPKRYIQGFCIIVIALAIAREIKPSLAYSANDRIKADSAEYNTDSLLIEERADITNITATSQTLTSANLEDSSFKPHRIYSVSSFHKAFPDQNDVQLIAAQKNGVSLVSSRKEAEERKNELVYIGSNPYFYTERAKNSIPYLVPKAASLLQDIGATFFDSLQIKGIPLHKIIVTSVLRTKDDVEDLQKRNFNAVANSCHQYATTFDICYYRYKTVADPDGPKRRTVANDTLQWVLSEVLNDMRKQGKCYIKYEHKQSCFHITVR